VWTVVLQRSLLCQKGQRSVLLTTKGGSGAPIQETAEVTVEAATVGTEEEAAASAVTVVAVTLNRHHGVAVEAWAGEWVAVEDSAIGTRVAVAAAPHSTSIDLPQAAAVVRGAVVAVAAAQRRRVEEVVTSGTAWTTRSAVEVVRGRLQLGLGVALAL
jgi:hypothetical protein